MDRLLGWIKRQGDHNIVSYSRFGLPGDETDDRPPPTSIHVAKFDAESPEYMTFGVHSQKASIISAGIGMSVTIFVFLSTFFEFDWYHHTKGIDFGALAGLLLFLFIGILCHWWIVRGVKTHSPRLLIPFILAYIILIVMEVITVILLVNNWVAGTYLRGLSDVSVSGHHLNGYLVTSFMLIIVIIVQSAMLHPVIRCRNYLEKRLIHELEMVVAEKSKRQYPGIRVIVGNSGDINGLSIGLAARSVDSPQVAPSDLAPQRTILNGGDGII